VPKYRDRALFSSPVMEWERLDPRHLSAPLHRMNHDEDLSSGVGVDEEMSALVSCSDLTPARSSSSWSTWGWGV
jgi:hypothetical protein